MDCGTRVRPPSSTTSFGSWPTRGHIKAAAEKIWAAITDPEWTNRSGYTGYANYDLQPGGAYTHAPNEDFKAAGEAGGNPCPDLKGDGEAIAADPSHKLTTTWRMLMDPAHREEGFTRLTYEINPIDETTCSLTVTHELDERHPSIFALVTGSLEDTGAGGGWAWVLSDLKSLVETGTDLAG